MEKSTTMLMFFSLAAAGCQTAMAAPPPVTPPAPSTSHASMNEHHGRDVGPVYRLDFTVVSDSDSVPAHKLSMNLEEHSNGEVRSGMNVPLAPSNARQDVGFLLKASYMMTGDDLMLVTDTELSAADDASRIRKLVTRSEALVAPGKPTMVALVEDAKTKTKFELDVTATKLR